MKPVLLTPELDVDTYLAKGGKLLDLVLMEGWLRSSWEARLKKMSDKELRRANARMSRIARFLEGLGKLGSPLGRELVVTEEQARAVWRETAKRQRPAMTDDDKY
jgi:ABC-type ATPase with predicted acetyltransferase domain